MPGSRYKKVGLFGGALECELPDNFADVRYASSITGALCRRSPDTPTLSFHFQATDP
jgi:hypothetical protein